METLSLTDLAFCGLVVSGLCAEVLVRRRAGVRRSTRRRPTGPAPVAVVRDARELAHR